MKLNCKWQSALYLNIKKKKLIYGFYNAQLGLLDQILFPEEHGEISCACCLTDLDLTKLCWISSSKPRSLASGTLP